MCIIEGMNNTKLLEMVEEMDSKEIVLKVNAEIAFGVVSINLDMSFELLKDLILLGDRAKVGNAFLKGVATSIENKD